MNNNMQAKRIPPNGTIGLFSPCHVADPARYGATIAGIKRMGFDVKELGDHFYKDTWGYAASAQERADDFNALVTDDSVHAILFNGGHSAAEILPYIDYDNLRRHPKRIGSYSDGTSILNAIYAHTGLVVYYGTAPRVFADLRHYDYQQFCGHFVEGHRADHFTPNSERVTLHGGTCEGTLLGGYTTLFTLMLSSKYMHYNEDAYILFLESHEKYGTIGLTAEELAFLEQTPLMPKVKGLVFGHYSVETPHHLLRCLERFGQRHDIPVIYTDDFGHGTRHGILPIGLRAKLDAHAQSVAFGA